MKTGIAVSLETLFTKVGGTIGRCRKLSDTNQLVAS